MATKKEKIKAAIGYLKTAQAWYKRGRLVRNWNNVIERDDNGEPCRACIIGGYYLAVAQKTKTPLLTRAPKSWSGEAQTLDQLRIIPSSLAMRSDVSFGADALISAVFSQNKTLIMEHTLRAVRAFYQKAITSLEKRL